MNGELSNASVLRMIADCEDVEVQIGLAAGLEFEMWPTDDTLWEHDWTPADVECIARGGWTWAELCAMGMN